MRILKTIVLLSQICVMALHAGTATEGKIESATNKDKKWLVQLFQKSAASLSIDSEGAHFHIRPDQAKFCLGNPFASNGGQSSSFQFEFTLTKPGEMFYSPDHHSMRIFKVKQITPDKLVLSYETTFDHHPFSKDLVTKDSGEIELLPFNQH